MSISEKNRTEEKAPARAWSHREKLSAEPDAMQRQGAMTTGIYRLLGQLLSAYRLLALALAVPLVIAFPLVNRYSDIIPVSPLFLVVFSSAYTLSKTIEPSRWRQIRTVNTGLLALDILVCAFLVNISGGLHSPFVLYTMTPVVRAALSQDVRVTVVVGAITTLYVFSSFFSNPVSLATPAAAAVDFSAYAVGLAIVAILPYLISSRLL